MDRINARHQRETFAQLAARQRVQAEEAQRLAAAREEAQRASERARAARERADAARAKLATHTNRRYRLTGGYPEEQ